MTFKFRPAAEITERHGLFVALVGGTNAGKTFSALRLARGIAGPRGKVAVLDTEGGRTLHLKDAFAFDVDVMSPPHRPERYLDAARTAQEAGYSCLVVDSFSMEWRGVGGVLDWIDEEIDVAVERRRAFADEKGWKFDENREREKVKASSSIRPKMSHKLMVSGLLGLRMPIVFAIRGEEVYDPDAKTTKFKAQCSPSFRFEVTVSFRLASDRKGIIDLSDPEKWKMEGAHAAIFKDGEQLSEQHGEKLAAWAAGGATAAPKEPAPANASPPDAVGAGAPPPPDSAPAPKHFDLPEDLKERARVIVGALRRAKTQKAREDIITAQTKAGVLLKIKNANAEAYDWIIAQATPAEQAAA